MSKYDVILDVYENQSISKAAQKHNYTQSAVSQTIRNYEKEIGLKLFKRSKNGMEALPGTEPIFEELMHIRSANTRIDQIVSNINNLDSGFIRIGTVQSIAYNWLPGVLKNFSAEYPNITFRLYVDGLQNLTEKLRKKNWTVSLFRNMSQRFPKSACRHRRTGSGYFPGPSSCRSADGIFCRY